MQVQQKDNETNFFHHFKTAAKWCAINTDTVAICIFVKGLWDEHTTAAKIYEKDPQTFVWSH